MMILILLEVVNNLNTTVIFNKNSQSFLINLNFSLGQKLFNTLMVFWSNMSQKHQSVKYCYYILVYILVYLMCTIITQFISITESVWLLILLVISHMLWQKILLYKKKTLHLNKNPKYKQTLYNIIFFSVLPSKTKSFLSDKLYRQLWT